MDEEQFTVSTRAVPGAVVVVAVGDIDLQTSTLLRSELWNVIERTEEPLVLLDATNVAFMSSAGLAVLVTAADLAGQRGRRFLVVTGQQRIIPRSLHIAGLDRFVSTCAHYPDGLAVEVKTRG